MNRQIRVRSTTKGVVLSIGKQEPCLLHTQDVAILIDVLNASLQGCGMWEVDIPLALTPPQFADLAEAVP